MPDRVTAYRYAGTDAQTDAACEMFRRLLLAGLCPWFVWEPTITLTVADAEKLRQLQREQPERFGGC